MNFQEAIRSVFQNWSNFSGRARRSEYWYFTLFNIIVNFVLYLVFTCLLGWTWVPSLYALLVLIPGLSCCVRRLHDTNRSGWWILLSIVPIVNLILIWFAVQDSTEDNQYGPNPKA